MAPDVEHSADPGTGADVHYLRNGSYQVTYTCSRTGPYSVVVNFLGDPVNRIPRRTIRVSQVTVGAGKALPRNCLARGPGLVKAGAGVPALVAILVQDELGNPKELMDPHAADSTVRGRGLHAYLTRDGFDHGEGEGEGEGETAEGETAEGFVGSVTVTPAALRSTVGVGPHRQEVEKVLSGMYNVIYRAVHPGTYRLHVKLDGEYIKDAPFKIDVRRLDVDHRDRAVADEMLYSAELAYSWANDPSGSVLREVAGDDVYGTSLLVDAFERERRQAERAAKKRLKVMRLGNYEMDLDAIMSMDRLKKKQRQERRRKTHAEGGGGGGGGGGGNPPPPSESEVTTDDSEEEDDDHHHDVKVDPTVDTLPSVPSTIPDPKAVIPATATATATAVRRVVEEPSVAETMQRVFAKKVGAGGSWMEGHQAVLAKKAVQDRWSKGIGNVVAREREIKKVQMSQEVGRVMLRSRIPTRQV